MSESSAPVAAKIRSLVEASIPVSELSLENESDQHSGPAGRESHFRLVVVSPAFEGLNRVKRHQRIYALVAELMPQPVHALALHTFTEAEWAARGQQANQSPNCRGGA
jgi:BolA protein